MKKKLLGILLLSIATTQAQITENFGKQMQSIMNADASQLLTNETEKTSSYSKFKTDFVLDNFDLEYVLSGIIPPVFYAAYKKEGTEDDMDAIFDKLNTISCLVFDSKYSPEKFKIAATSQREILVKSNKTAKTLFLITFDKKNKIFISFEIN